MDICRLCFQPWGQNVTNSPDILETLRNFLPYLNSCLKVPNLELCDPCLQNIQVITKLKTILNQTDEKIKAEMEKSKLTQINLLELIPTSNGLVKSSVCRICLNIVSDPEIFLYENEINLFRHDLILHMFKFCKIVLDCTSSKKPVMCFQCWNNLQICYSFKKNYLETDKKIRAYCILFKISAKSLSDEVIQQMSKYFLEQADGIHTDVAVMIKREIFCDNIVDNKGYALRKRLKKEYYDEMPVIVKVEKKPLAVVKSECENNSKLRSENNPKYRRHVYTEEENDFLIKSYNKYTNLSNALPWRHIHRDWCHRFNPSLSATTLGNRIKRILLKNKKRNPAAPKKTLPYVNIEPTKSLFVSLPPLPESDSDDSFIDEVKPSSFAPNIKTEQLSDNDEIHIIEQKTERIDSPDLPPSETESDIEDLPIPLLERMDLPPMHLKIQDIYSLDVKKETFNMISANGDIEHNYTIEDLNTCKRIVIKNDNNENIYRCMQCNFETKYQTSADRHAIWHSNPKNKGFQCEHCPFVTSKYFLLKHHLTTHYGETGSDTDEIPVLIPFTV